jgi:hypothetical protein
MRLLTRSRALIGTERRIALNQLDAIERDAQLLGDQLCLRGVQALADLALAGKGGDAAVGIDRDPRVELVAAGAIEPLRIEHARRQAEILRHARHAEADDQRAGAFEEGTAVHAFTSWA